MPKNISKLYISGFQKVNNLCNLKKRTSGDIKEKFRANLVSKSVDAFNHICNAYNFNERLQDPEKLITHLLKIKSNKPPKKILDCKSQSISQKRAHKAESLLNAICRGDIEMAMDEFGLIGPGRLMTNEELPLLRNLIDEILDNELNATNIRKHFAKQKIIEEKNQKWNSEKELEETIAIRKSPRTNISVKKTVLFKETNNQKYRY